MQLSRSKYISILLVPVLLLVALPAAAKFQLWPKGKLEVVPVGKVVSMKNYLLVDAEGLTIPLTGPGEITGYAKAHYPPGDTALRQVALQLSGVPGLPASLDFDFKAPTRGTYADGRTGLPSSGKKLALSIPAGNHELRITGPSGGRMMLILYYEGPEQPMKKRELPATPKPPQAKKKAKKKTYKFMGFKLSSSASLKFTADDNAYKYSWQFIDEYQGGWAPEKYQFMDSVGDVIVAPGISLNGSKKIWDIGTTKLSLKYSRLQYLRNTKLANQEFRFVVRQGTGKGKSIEVYYSYSPSKYLRQLNDRPPTISDNIPVVSEEFRLTRNKIVTAWRQKVNKKLSLKLALTYKLYYYNRPHIENDINAFDWQGTLYWTLAKPVRLTLDYTYTDANALGIDIDGQELATSPASDGTYKGNKYNVELRWKPPFKQLVNDLTVRAQYSVAYFSAEGTEKIEDDPYHVGRQDNVYTYQIKGSRKLPWRKIGTNFGFSYAERDVDSPWWGDIKEDKNWISRTWWLGFSYKLF
jgi:hypothetical protein